METPGVENCHEVPGLSAERGCYQYLDSTYRLYAREIVGYVPPRTAFNEQYITTKKIQKWLDAGYTAREIALMWNGGDTVVKRGVNRYGQAYDTGHYSMKVLAQLNP